ncbi:prohibitin family protein [Kitasatospora sp. NPDC002040]|uniref:prohibitin family protein n=1 Tax=Kitasatospora sp. NPDC002040 TaxID=3154661 RepID=UPI003324110E
MGLTIPMLFLSVLLVVVGLLLVVLKRTGALGFRAATPAGSVLGLLGLLLGLSTFASVVAPYQVAVPVSFGKVGEPWKSGVHLKSPFTDVTTFSTRPVDLNLAGETNVEVRSSQGGVLYADLTVKWSIDPAHTLALYKLAGDESSVERRLVTPDTREIVRNVFARYTSEDGYVSKREAISSEIDRLIRERLAPRGILIETVNLRNVKPSEALQKEIDLKIQQEQATLRATEAARTAKAEAEQKRIVAEGEAAANTILSNSLSDKVLAVKCLEAFRAAAEKNPVYASPCGSGTGAPLIVDGTKR